MGLKWHEGAYSIWHSLLFIFRWTTALITKLPLYQFCSPLLCLSWCSHTKICVFLWDHYWRTCLMGIVSSKRLSFLRKDGKWETERRGKIKWCWHTVSDIVLRSWDIWIPGRITVAVGESNTCLLAVISSADLSSFLNAFVLLAVIRLFSISIMSSLHCRLLWQKKEEIVW